MSSDGNSNENVQGSLDFSGLILSFSSAAMHYLQETSGTASDQNLLLAKQNIEIIKLLEAKTSGNLNDDEQKLIKQLLNELHLKFAKISNSSKS